MNKTKLCNIVFILAFLYCLCLASVTSAQVVFTDDEARMLGHELMIAKQSIQNSREQISQSKLKLEKALTDLEAQKQNLIVQNVQLNAANKSLELLNQEVKKEMRSLKRQRNIAYVVASVAVYIALRK